MDANKYIYTGQLGCALTDPDVLDMQEPVQANTGEAIGPTFFCGSKSINAVWVTKDLHVSNAAVVLVGYGIGNHRMFILEVTNHSFLGVNNPPIPSPHY